MQATRHQGAYTSVPQLQYNCVPKFAKSLVGTNTTANCPAPQDFANGSALMAYNSTTFYDDLTYAAAWMYKATGGQQCCPALVLGVQPPASVQSAIVYCCPHCSVLAGLARCSQHHRLQQALASCTCCITGWLLQAPLIRWEPGMLEPPGGPVVKKNCYMGVSLPHLHLQAPQLT